MSIGNEPSDAPSAADPSVGSPAAGPSIGQALAQARRDSGLTVEEISAATRVRSPIVHAIEEDDFARCGGDVYARGHIRTLAVAVGLDPAPLVRKYDVEHGGRPAPTPVAPVYEAERIRPEQRRPNWTAAMIAAIVVVVGFVGFTLIDGKHSGGRPVAGGASQARPTAASPAASASGRSSAKPGPVPSRSAMAAVPADKVTVKLTADNGKSWVAVTDDNGHSLFQGILQNGQSQTFTNDKRIYVVLGNAGAVRMFVNGKDLGPAGRKGQLLRTNFTPGDPQAG